MRPIIYIIVLAIALLVFKAFFLDAYLAERKAAESNASVGVSEPMPVVKSANVPVKRLEGNDTTDMRMIPNYKEAPLEKLGDKIADKIEDKL